MQHKRPAPRHAPPQSNKQGRGNGSRESTPREKGAATGRRNTQNQKQQSKEKIREQVKKIKDTLDVGEFIFNLGRGIMPQTPIENVECLVEEVRKK